MPDLLIAGFEPFPPYRENPSWVVAEALCAALIEEGTRASAVCLPVDFGATQAALAAALESERPRAALLLGLSGQTAFLDLEQVALNVGERPAGELGVSLPFPLTEAAPGARFNPMDWASAAQRLREQGLPVRISFHAGTFLCNAAYHFALGWAEDKLRRRALFVHMPLLADQAARHYQNSRVALPSLSLETILTAMKSIARLMLDE